MIMDMPPSIESDVFQALQQPKAVVSVTPSTNALNPADLLVRLHNSIQVNSQSFRHQVSQVLSEAIALGPLSVSIPAPTPMTGGGGNNPIEKVDFALLGGGGGVELGLPVPMGGGGTTQPVEPDNHALLGGGGSGQPSNDVKLVLLNGEEGWIPPVPMGGGGSSQPSDNVNLALLEGEEGWVPPVPMGGGGSSKPSDNVKLSSIIS